MAASQVERAVDAGRQSLCRELRVLEQGRASAGSCTRAQQRAVTPLAGRSARRRLALLASSSRRRRARSSTQRPPRLHSFAPLDRCVLRSGRLASTRLAPSPSYLLSLLVAPGLSPSSRRLDPIRTPAHLASLNTSLFLVAQPHQHAHRLGPRLPRPGPRLRPVERALAAPLRLTRPRRAPGSPRPPPGLEAVSRRQPVGRRPRRRPGRPLVGQDGALDGLVPGRGRARPGPGRLAQLWRGVLVRQPVQDVRRLLRRGVGRRPRPVLQPVGRVRRQGCGVRRDRGVRRRCVPLLSLDCLPHS